MIIPDVLRKSTPRPVGLTAGGKALTVFASTLILVAMIGGALLYVKAESDADRRALRSSDAVTVPGVIVASKRQSGEGVRWRMTYSFPVDGIERQGHLTTKPAIPVGSAISVGYLRSDPADHWIVGHEPRGLWFGIAPLFSVVFLAISVLIFSLIRRQRYLLSDGRAAVAHVTASRRHPGAHGSNLHVHFEFRLLNGAMQKGKLETNGKGPALDSEFIVVYDPDQPGSKARYPMSLVRVLQD